VTTCLDPQWDRIERSPIEFPVLVVRDANGATPRTQIRTHDRKLACEALGPFERDLSVFEDHAALTLELFVDDEIKMDRACESPSNQSMGEPNILQSVSR
jgi:hypothetical protein